MSRRFAALPVALALLAPLSVAQVFGPAFATDYSFVDLGTPAAIPSPLGGVNFKPGDLNTLWLGGAANTSAGAIYEIGVTRGAGGHITAFNGTATLHANAPNIDGGLAFGPTGVLFFTGYPVNTLGEFLPGSTTVNKTVTLTSAGITSSVGSIAFVPNGFPGAGRFKVLSYSSSEWYDVQLVADGQGTFDVANAQLRASLAGGLEGAVYVGAGNPGFSVASTLVCEYSAGKVGAYDLDANGDPVLASRRDFMTGLTGAEGALIDPVTGDFIFSTFGGGNRVLVIKGFTQPTVYCTPKLNSLGCTPTIGFTGLPSATGPDNFFVTATSVRNRKNGLLLWGTAPDATPFHGGTLCVLNPAKFLPMLDSVGNPPPANDCTGAYSVHVTQAFLTANGFTPGTAGYVQFTMRDPGFAPPDSIALTAALRFVVGN